MTLYSIELKDIETSAVSIDTINISEQTFHNTYFNKSVKDGEYVQPQKTFYNRKETHTNFYFSANDYLPSDMQASTNYYTFSLSFPLTGVPYLTDTTLYYYDLYLKDVLTKNFVLDNPSVYYYVFQIDNVLAGVPFTSEGTYYFFERHIFASPISQAIELVSPISQQETYLSELKDKIPL